MVKLSGTSLTAQKSLEYNYVDGLKEGAQFTYQHGRLFTTENYVSGKRHGWAIYFSPVTGCVTEEGEFFNDQRNGLWYTYDGLYLVEVTLYRLDSIVKSVYRNPNYEGISEYFATPASECSCGSSPVKEIK
ncbi:MAG: hypothetical protein JNN04_09495 [Cyclobacteriaceae bacterium]|nr:hypothetical protein [Cyclobacteriaceae bacterium]